MTRDKIIAWLDDPDQGADEDDIYVLWSHLATYLARDLPDGCIEPRVVYQIESDAQRVVDACGEAWAAMDEDDE